MPLLRVLVLLGVWLGAVGAAAAGPPVQVRDAWIRWLPAGLPGAGYMTLTNDGSRVCVLKDAVSAAYGSVSLHRTRERGGMSTMEPVESIVLQPHETVRFAVGGLHLMLMQPSRPLHPGDQVVVTLRFADGSTLDVIFPVRAGDAS